VSPAQQQSVQERSEHISLIQQGWFLLRIVVTDVIDSSAAMDAVALNARLQESAK